MFHKSLALILALPALASAAPEVRRAEVAVPHASTSTSSLSVGTLGAKEQSILRKLDRMSPGQLSELLEAYARMGNPRMCAALSQALIKKDPGNVKSRQLATSLLQDSTAGPDDPTARKAEELLLNRQPAEAARLLTELKQARFQNRMFPWQDDLAYALYDSGQIPLAKAAFQETLTTSGYSDASRNEAQKALRVILIDALSKAGDEALGRKESTQALKLADQLLAATPGDPDAIALKAGAYSAGGRPQKAIDYLLGFKKTAPAGRFVHQMALAGAYHDARMFDHARTAYQVILTDPASPPADLAEVTLHLKELERDSRLTAGDHALRTGQLARAEAVLKELEILNPGQTEVLSFRAAVHLRRRQYGSARDTLTHLRNRSVTKKTFFDSRDLLAESLAATNSPKAAAAEYAQIKDDARFDTLTRYEAARRTSDLHSRYRPTLSQDIEAASEVEGTRLSTTNELSTGEIAGTGNLFMIRTAWDNVELDQSRLLNMKETERYQVEAVWRRNIENGFFGEVSGGASNRHAVYGAAIGRYARPGATAWEFSYRGNDRALDSLPLIAMDGRQDQVALTLQRDITDRLSMDASVRYRWVEARGQELGQGLNLNLNATYVLLTEKPTRPELSLSYQGELQRFSRRNFGQDFGDRMLRTSLRGQFSGRDLAENIIEERINRHGLIFTLSKKFSPRFSGQIYGGMAREFENKQNEGLAGAGLEAFVGPRTTLFMNVDYTTSGRAGSRGAEVWSAYAGARVSF